MFGVFVCVHQMGVQQMGCPRLVCLGVHTSLQPPACLPLCASEAVFALRVCPRACVYACPMSADVGKETGKGTGGQKREGIPG